MDSSREMIVYWPTHHEMTGTDGFTIKWLYTDEFTKKWLYTDEFTKK